MSTEVGRSEAEEALEVADAPDALGFLARVAAAVRALFRAQQTPPAPADAAEPAARTSGVEKVE